MKVSLNWLKELVEIPADVAALCELLTKAGVEVEGIETRGCAVEKVVVAQILESLQHPNADRLHVCKVADGSSEPRQIVCGARNYKVGDKVPLALPGAVMPGDFKIKVGKLRGVESAGMMCSAKELALAEDAEGLLILPPETVVGTPLTELFPPETVLDVEVTPNRPDLLSHVGMAREIATLLGKPLTLPAAILATAGTGSQAADDITLEAPEACPFYTARRVRGVKVGPSPAWLQGKLEAVGLRSINNIVDVTNYVMLEMGQPLHAFDLALLKGGIRVRHAVADEKFLALDGKTYPLAQRDLVIADAERALAIAGVMGGEESGVTESTVDILLESAYFTPAEIRRTSRELSLSSDASYRYERGIDPAGVLPASARAIALILEVAGGEAEPVAKAAGAAPRFEPDVPFRLERCRAVLGTDVAAETVDRILTGFGLGKTAQGWQAPSFRQDLVREIDLIEEIARVIGIEAVPARQQTRFTPGTPADQRHDQAMRLRRRLSAPGLGFLEARGLTLISEKALAVFPVDGSLRVRNPLNEDQAILRPSLVPGLLEALTRNVRLGTGDLRLFEIGRIFRADAPEERTTLALVWSGAAAPASWRDAKPRPADFFDLKGALAALGLEDLTLEPASHPALALAVELRRGKETVGLAGQLTPARGRDLDATGPVLVAEINLDAFDPAPASGRFGGLPKFPAVTRDIAMIVPVAVPHAQIEAVLRSANESLLAGIELFDVFTDPKGEKIPADQKSVAYALTYRCAERTLTAEEVAQAHQRLKERLKAELAVSLRE
ncbi:MAG: phenylalanine--tRNA ligase subunit beta [Chthoniobacteraceae bacterium]|nr:phenylalanine--tRNA ligase subunit beta [Chthoniobacteraceae bacterium]